MTGATVTVTAPGNHDTYTLRPYVFGTATSSAGGTVQTFFYVRTSGTGTWNIANAIEVDVASGTVAQWRFPDQAGRAGGKYDWQMQACQGGSCSVLTTIATFQIDPMVASGDRSYLGSYDQGVSAASSLHVNYSTGNLTVDSTDLSIAGIGGLNLNFARAYNSITDPTLIRTDFGAQWTNALVDLSTGTQSNGSLRLIGPSGYLAQFTFVSGTTYTVPTGLDADLRVSGSTRTITFHHDNSGYRAGDVLTFTGANLTTIADKHANTLSLAYNPSVAGQVTSITDNQTGRSIALSNYNTAGQARTVTDSSGRVLTYGYDSSGNLTSFADAGVGTIAGDAATVYAYNSTGLMTQLTDPSGRVTKIAYNTAGQVASVTAGYGTSDSAETDFVYYPVGDSHCTAHSALYACTTLARDQVTQPPAVGSTYELSTFYVDQTGRVVFITDPAGHNQAKTWDVNSNTTTISDKMTTPNLSTVAYDPTGTNNPTSVVDATGMTNTLTYANTATPFQPDTQTLPNNAATPTSTRTSYSYAAAGSSTTFGDVTSQSQNAGATVLRATYQGDGTTTCSAKAGEKCTSTNGKTGVTSYGYDTHGNLISVTPPAPLGALAYTPDTLGRDTTIVDGKSQSSTVVYDVLDRITEIDYPATAKKITYTYDGDSNTTAEAVTVAGATVNYAFSYDNLNRLTHKTLPANTTIVTDNAYTYDKLGNLLTVHEYGGTTPTNISLTTTYTYDITNLLTTQLSATTDPAGVTGSTVSVKYTNDANGQRTETDFGATPSEKQTFTYDNAGRQVQDKDHHSGVGDNYNVVTCYVNPVADCPATATPTVYPGGGVVTAVKQRALDTVSGITTSYGYDALSRLTAATQSTGGTDARSYVYDADGNRTSQTINGTVTGYTYNTADQATTTGYTYDGNGNGTATPALSAVAYNPLNQTTSITKSGVSTPFTYAAGDQDSRTSANSVDAALSALGTDVEASGSTYHFYLRDPTGNLVALINDAGGYSTTRYPVRDTQGSVIALTDGSGNVTDTWTYDPYGNQLARTGTTYNPFRYNAGYTDTSTGLQHLGARYYNPTDGRFTQQDPAGQSPNLYAYTGDNPLNFSDPTGTLSIGLSGQLCFGVCIGGSVSVDTSGNVGLSISAGVGSPGAGGGVAVSTSNVGVGLSANVTTTCSAGPVSASYDYLSGAANASVGTQISSGDCSTTAGASYGF